MSHPKSPLSCIILVLLTFSLISCVSTPKSKQTREQKVSDVLSGPREAFLKIQVSIVAELCDSHTRSCHSDTVPLASGSGSVIRHSVFGGSYVLTAAHVCQPQKIKTDAKIGPVSITAHLEAKGISKEGKRYDLTLVSLDNESDLCILYGKRIERSHLNFSPSGPLPGSKVYNIAAPAGILHKNSPIIVDGYFNGHDTEMNNSVYSFPVTGGCSGSAILNEHGDVVGVVSMMNTNFPFVVYSPGYDAIKNFTESSILSHRLLMERERRGR